MLWQHINIAFSQQNNPEKVVISSDKEALSFHQLSIYVEQLALYMIELGVKPGHIVLGFFDNCPAFLVTFLACSHVGCAFAPIDINSTEMEIQSIIQATSSKFLITGISTFKNFHTFEGNVVALSSIGKVEQCKNSNSDSFPLIVDSSIGCIQFTSGTTGIAKGILLSHAALLSRAQDIKSTLNLNSSDNALCTVPLSHSHGLECVSMSTLLAGGTLFIKSPQFSFPHYILEEIERLQITFYSTVPNFYDVAVSLELDNPSNLSHVKHLICGSAALSPATEKAFFKKFKVCIQQGYGLSELTAICLNRRENIRENSVGQILQGIEWKLEGDPESNQGELLVRSRSLFSGYLNDDESTVEKLQNGWLRTDDIMRVDEQGFFYIIGRSQEFSKIRGFKVHVGEVENAILSQDSISECVVLVNANDDGDYLTAYVVPKVSQFNAAAMQTTLINELKKILSTYKIPEKWVFKKSLPKTALGKLQRSRHAIEEHTSNG